MGRISILLGTIALGVAGFFGLPLIFALILAPISNSLIENKGWAGIIAIFGGAIIGVGLPRLYVKWLDRTTSK
ncbi:hypothetical protein ACI6PO_08815 [Agrobacterium tumefaciens]